MMTRMHFGTRGPAKLLSGLTALAFSAMLWIQPSTAEQSDNFFQVIYDITPKAGPMAGNRMTMQEMGLYTVAKGKITKEEFFYDMG